MRGRTSIPSWASAWPAASTCPGAPISTDSAPRTVDGWLVGWGLDPNCFGQLSVTNRALADVIGNAPMLLRLFDGHSALVGDEALRHAGITGAREFAARSEIVCDERGRPTGLLLEEPAMAPVLAAIPQPSFAERRTELKTLLDAIAATGLCGGRAMDCDGDAPQLFESLDEAGELPLRHRIAPWRRPEDAADRVAELLDMQGRGGRLWQIAGVKLFMDGTIDNGTAWLDEPDCHGASTAPYWRDPHDYPRAVHDLAARGVQTATHASATLRWATSSRRSAACPRGPLLGTGSSTSRRCPTD